MRRPTIVLACLATLAAAGPTNLILLVSDDGGYAEYGFQQPFVGKTIEFQTPNLDRLAAQSVVFSNGYVSGAVCSPSRAGFITGRYQQRLGYEYNISNNNVWDDGMPTWHTMLTERFQAAGLTTGCIGKWHFGSAPDHQPQSQGVDHFFGLWGGSRPYFQQASAESDRVQRLKRNTTNVDWWTEPSYNGIPADTGGKGRHLTDAFGDEASKFIADHAGDPGGFFLYVPFTSPHGPYDEAKQQDINRFDSTGFGAARKRVAALIYAMDRAVGFMMDRLEDPNDDGDASDSVLDDTVIAFFVDNGGATTAEYTHDNTPLRGYKSSTWEGGIRVPFFLKIPGVAAGVYHEPVISLDATATLLAAAGLPLPADLEGVNLKPFLTGQATGSPHQALFWRQGEKWAVRKGEWKLANGNGGTAELYQLNPDGSGESFDHSTARPEKRLELLREFTAWDLRNAKPRWSTSSPPANIGNRFQFRPQDGLPNWSAAQVWSNPDDDWTRVNLTAEDAFADCILQFPARADLSYTSNNNMTRQTGLEFALNEIRLVASVSGTTDRTGTITGNPLLLARNLADTNPSISNQAGATGGMSFTFHLHPDLLLLDDLDLAGDGNAGCTIHSSITDYHQPRAITKSGTSSFTLAGTCSHRGSTSVAAGELVLTGTLDSTSSVNLTGGALQMEAGSMLRVPELKIAGGAFAMKGGTLATPLVTGTLAITGGTFSPGLSPAATIVTGDYSQDSASTLLVELAGTTPATDFDTLTIAGTATLAGTLAVTLPGGFTPAHGQRFKILTAGSITGAFTTTSFPALDPGLTWVLRQTATSIELRIGTPSDTDGDLLDDSWETTHFGSLDTSDAGTDDFDRDGQSDLLEFLAGTSPVSGASLFSPTALAGVSEFGLTFDAIPGRLYQLETAHSPAGPWTPGPTLGPLGGPAPGHTISIPSDSSPARFARLRISLP